MLELLATVARRLEEQGVAYAVCGSVAASLYAQPRSTLDIDVVAAVTLDDVTGLAACFPEPEFYFDAQMARSAVLAPPRMFNILHVASGMKIDVYVAPGHPAGLDQLGRRRRILLPGDGEVWVQAPEDLILMKLLYYAEGHSDKHLADCANLLAIDRPVLDRAYLDEHSQRLGVEAVWRRLCSP